MTDIEKRAHDIAVAILPRMIEEDKLPYIVPSGKSGNKFNAYDVADLYEELYEALLKELEEYGGF